MNIPFAFFRPVRRAGQDPAGGRNHLQNKALGHNPDIRVEIRGPGPMWELSRTGTGPNDFLQLPDAGAPISAMSELRNVADAEITVLDERLILLPERAVYWPAREALLVADAHFGKPAAGRGHGVAGNGLSIAESLARLDAILARYRVRQVIFLGDVLQFRKAGAEAIPGAFAAWREKHARVDIIIVRSTQDGHGGEIPRELRIKSVAEPYKLEPFILCHEPAEGSRGYALAGHLHPAIVLRGQRNQHVRLPCFWITPEYAVLPAFGSFTGTYLIQRRPGDHVLAVADNHVVAV